MRILTYVLLLGFLVLGPAVALNMRDRFAFGSTCSQEQQDILGTVLTDAITLVDLGIKSADALIDWRSESQKQGEERNEFLNQLFAGEIAFGLRRGGADEYNDVALATRDTQQLESVKANLETVINALNGEGADLPKTYFHCDDSQFEYTTDAFDIFGEGYIPKDAPDTSIKTFTEGEADGLWYDTDPAHMDGTLHNFVTEERPCDEGTDAAVFPSWDGVHYANMFFCPEIWNNPRYFRSLAALRTAVENQPQFTLAYLDDHPSLPGVFEHEMMHLMNQCIIDEKIEVADTPAHPDKTKLVKCYRTTYCHILGKERGSDGFKRTLTNANSYHMFSLLSFFKDKIMRNT